jgi:hypothetical protein
MDTDSGRPPDKVGSIYFLHPARRASYSRLPLDSFSLWLDYTRGTEEEPAQVSMLKYVRTRAECEAVCEAEGLKPTPALLSGGFGGKLAPAGFYLTNARGVRESWSYRLAVVLSYTKRGRIRTPRSWRTMPEWFLVLSWIRVGKSSSHPMVRQLFDFAAQCRLPVAASVLRICGNCEVLAAFANFLNAMQRRHTGGQHEYEAMVLLLKLQSRGDDRAQLASIAELWLRATDGIIAPDINRAAQKVPADVIEAFQTCLKYCEPVEVPGSLRALASAAIRQ